MAGVVGLELGNVALHSAGPNSLVFQNIFVPETFRGGSCEKTGARTGNPKQLWGAQSAREGSAEPETSPPETIRVAAAMPQIRSPVD